MSAVFLLLVVFLCLVLLLLLLRSFNEWLYLPRSLPSSVTLPRGSLQWPFLGDILTFLRLYKSHPDSYLSHRFFSKYGSSDGIYKTHLFGSPSIITCSPDMLKFVLSAQGEASSFLTGWPSPTLMGPKSLIMVHGMQHKRVRQLIAQGIVHPVAMDRAFDRLRHRFGLLLAGWAEDGTVTLRDRMKKMVFEDICETFLGLKPGPVVNAMEDDFLKLLAGMRAQPINLPGFSHHTALQCRKRLQKVVSSVVQSRRRTASTDEGVRDFLDAFFEARYADGSALTDEEICDNMVSLLLGGHASTAYLIVWSMILLAKHPDVLTRLREEHMSLRKENEDIKMSDMKKMPYTDLVINEVLRLVNIAPFVFRTVGKEDVHYKGYLFPKGWKVIAWIRAPHTDPSIFPDPYKFDPERFQGFTPPTGTFLPFGYGARFCPGYRFSLMAARIFLHILALNYKWELLNPNARITYLPHPTPIDGGQVSFGHL